MNQKNRLLFVAVGAFALATISFSTAEARGRVAAGPSGVAGGWADKGQWGHTVGGFGLGKNAGAGFRNGQYKGINGGTFNTSGKFAYKRGLGAGRYSKWNGTTSYGASGSGYTKSQYNAQTGQGARSSSEQVQSPAGKDYGYNGSTSYTKGKGGDTQIDTDHHGDYNVDWAKGQKPTVTPDTP